MTATEAQASNSGPNLPATQTPPAVILKAVSKVRQKKVKNRAKKGEFPAYVPGQSCIQQGKTHNYVDRGKYDECTNCGSSRRHYVAKTSAKTAKKARKAAVVPAAASTPSLPTTMQAVDFAVRKELGVILV